MVAFVLHAQTTRPVTLTSIVRLACVLRSRAGMIALARHQLARMGAATALKRTLTAASHPGVVCARWADSVPMATIAQQASAPVASARPHHAQTACRMATSSVWTVVVTAEAVVPHNRAAELRPIAPQAYVPTAHVSLLPVPTACTTVTKVLLTVVAAVRVDVALVRHVLVSRTALRLFASSRVGRWLAHAQHRTARMRLETRTRPALTAVDQIAPRVGQPVRAPSTAIVKATFASVACALRPHVLTVFRMAAKPMLTVASCATTAKPGVAVSAPMTVSAVFVLDPLHNAKTPRVTTKSKTVKKLASIAAAQCVLVAPLVRRAWSMMTVSVVCVRVVFAALQVARMVLPIKVKLMSTAVVRVKRVVWARVAVLMMSV